MNQMHKHHIVPRWRCKELGINPDFEDNFVVMTRLQHAHVHWGYYNKDLNPLLEVCKPKQYVLDMLELGNNKDSLAAVLIAEGEIEEYDIKGERNPMFGMGKHPSMLRRNQKISEALKGVSRPERRGDNNPMSRASLKKRGQKNPWDGRKHTEETIQKMRNSQTTEERKSKWTPEKKQIISEANKGRVPWNKGKKYNIITPYKSGKRYDRKIKNTIIAGDNLYRKK